jgi:hypothetical protein
MTVKLIKSPLAINRVNTLKLADVSETVYVALMVGTETVPETSGSFSVFTRLISREKLLIHVAVKVLNHMITKLHRQSV